MECAFCAVATGRAPVSTVYADDRVLAFCDIEPFTTGHTLVIPKRHGVALADVDPTDVARMFVVGQQVAAAARVALGCPGINLFLADGQAAWQTVFHAHLHVIPRWGRADRMRLTAKGRRRPPRTELDRLAGALASAPPFGGSRPGTEPG
ncbi:MAG: HIT domain-containing protein [Actinobacteria bacterium]|nr:HIT domain-containing protein [Actinomycetota bacterium]MBI3686844.1 HIT domain-containing protein [Actinomycetota bacterium]